MRRRMAFVALGALTTLAQPACRSAPASGAASASGSETETETETVSATALGSASARLRGTARSLAPVSLDLPPPAVIKGLDTPQVDIDDPHGSLARFFARTDALLRGTTRDPVRIAVYGDSNGTMDFITGEMRRILQTTHGDAGHGFVALARPWPWYIHQYVVTDSMKDAWWGFTVTTRPTLTMDPWYGQGMIAAQSKQKGARTWVETAPAGSPIGTSVGSFEVWYVTFPYGGAFDVEVDGQVKASADTHAEGDPHFGFVRVDVADGPHKMVAVSTTARPVRLIGAILDRPVPGFQVDGLGVGSQNCLCMLRESEALDKEIFAHRPYDLIVMHIGSNTWNPAVMDPVVCMKEVIARFRREVPDVSLMIMTPPDWGENGSKHTPRWFKNVMAQLRQAATEAPAAFYDFHAAMGGEGSMSRFKEHFLTEPDGVHFGRKGGAYMGQIVVAALGTAFDRWEESGRAGARAISVPLSASASASDSDSASASEAPPPGPSPGVTTVRMRQP